MLVSIRVELIERARRLSVCGKGEDASYTLAVANTQRLRKYFFRSKPGKPMAVRRDVNNLSEKSFDREAHEPSRRNLDLGQSRFPREGRRYWETTGVAVR